MLKKIILICILSAFSITLPASSAGLERDEIRIIVKYKLWYNQNAHKQLHHSATRNLPFLHAKPMAAGAYIFTFDARRFHQISVNEAVDQILQQLRQNSAIQYALIDRVGYLKPLPPTEKYTNTRFVPAHNVQWNQFSEPGGIMLESQPGLNDGAWYYTKGIASSPVIVAVLDTGITMHPNLVENFVKDEYNNIWGWNFSDNNRRLIDKTRSYHGAHVAGIIAATGNISGVGEELKILPLLIPDSNGMFYESSLINAIYWAVGGDVPGTRHNFAKAQVLNMSFGVDIGPGREKENCDKALQDAIDYAIDNEALIVTAAGNDNRSDRFNAPASCKGTLKIGATGPKGLKAPYSNYGGVTFAAPGGDTRYGYSGAILSTVNPSGGVLNSGYDFYQGTSMAAPHVAGVAGLLYAASEHTIDGKKAQRILHATTHNFGSSNKEQESCVGAKPCGHGIVNANAAVKATYANYDIIVSSPVMRLGKPDTPWINIAKGEKVAFPYVYMEDGKIYSRSKDAILQLDESLYSHCEIIGYDGVGCYKL